MNEPAIASDITSNPEAPRLVHRISDGFSSEARKILAAGIAARRPYKKLALELARAGARVSPRTIARWARELRGGRINSVAKVPRLTHRSTDILPREAWDMMYAGFRAGTPYSQIARQLNAIGTSVPERTIARRALEWRAECRRQMTLEQLGQQRDILDLGGTWLPELIGRVEELDLRAGWPQRRHKEIHCCLAAFLREPGFDRMRELQIALASFWLALLITSRLGREGGN